MKKHIAIGVRNAASVVFEFDPADDEVVSGFKPV
jgi:hypothetical protein